MMDKEVGDRNFPLWLISAQAGRDILAAPGRGLLRPVIPDEINSAVIIEAKITSDDGTARDKVARIKVLAEQRDRHVAEGRQPYEVVACIDGRGFRERREDMRQMLNRLNGKVFTSTSLEELIRHTRIREFAIDTPQP